MGVALMLANLATALAYFAIPLLILYFLIRRNHVRWSRLWFLFFVAAGGRRARRTCWRPRPSGGPFIAFTSSSNVTMAVVSWIAIVALDSAGPASCSKARASRNSRTSSRRREQAEQALREKEAVYKSLVEGLPLNVFRKDLAGPVCRCQPAVLRHARQAAERNPGQDRLRLFPGRAVPEVSPRRRARDADGRDAGGHRVLFQAERRQALRAGAQGPGPRRAGQDRRRAGDVLGRDRRGCGPTKPARQSDARFRKLVQSSLIGVMVARLDGSDRRSQRRVPAHARLLARRLRRRPPAVGCAHARPSTAPADDAGHRRSSRPRGTCPAWEKEYLHKDGHRVPVLVGVTMLEGSETDCICFVVDITQQKHDRAGAEERPRKRPRPPTRPRASSWPT